MTTRRMLLGGAVALVFAATAWMQTASGPAASAARFLPEGALLTLEARDFSGTWAAWEASPEKAAWTASDNHQEFSRSKLFLRLREAQGEFAAAAGFAPDWDLLRAVAGGESAVGLYDVGELRFLYVTEIGAARALENALWRSRANFEPREAAGRTFYVRRDPESGREAAFAAAGDRLVLATAADLAAGALALIADESSRGVTDADWYQAAIAEHGARGMLRVVADLQRLTRTPHFRSYWIQQNISELRTYRSSVADLELTAEGIAEKRRLVRLEATEPAGASTAAQLLAQAPADADLVRVHRAPSAEAAAALLREKLLAPPASQYGYAYNPAPYVPPDQIARAAGRRALETRIDRAPVAVARDAFDASPLVALFRDLQASLQIESAAPGDGFTGRRTAVVLQSATDWNRDAVLAALRASSFGLWTAAGLGAEWREADGIASVSGLRSLHVRVDGARLAVSDSRELLTELTTPAVEAERDLVYAARFAHAAARSGYLQTMRRLDFLSGGEIPRTQRSPHLFSENLGSLSETFERVGGIELRRYDRGAAVEESVLYRWGPE